MELPYDSAIPFLDIYPEKTIIQKDTFNVLAALFTITRTWKQPKYPSTEEWIKKMWYIYAINVSLVKSLSHVRLFATPWTVAHQAPPSMGFSRQEYWSGLPFYSAIKRSKTVQSAEMQLDLETVIQSEESQKEKKKSYNNFYMWNIENNVDELICKAEVKTHTKEWAYRY